MAIAAAPASAWLSKSYARVEAESVAASVFARKAWASSYKVGACARQSAHRVNCDARVTGNEFLGCEEQEPYSCEYAYHVCRFTVAVHEAGYSAIGRIRGMKCRATVYLE
jgi:hypothetical protein